MVAKKWASGRAIALPASCGSLPAGQLPDRQAAAACRPLDYSNQKFLKLKNSQNLHNGLKFNKSYAGLRGECFLGLTPFQVWVVLNEGTTLQTLGDVCKCSTS